MKNIYLFSISGVAAALFAAVFLATAANAQTASTSPYVKTYKTPNGVTVDMNLPNNFKGQVDTVYSNGQWETYSTTTPLTATDIANMQKQFEEEQASFQQLMNEQEQFFEQQQAMFQNMLGSGF